MAICLEETRKTFSITIGVAWVGSRYLNGGVLVNISFLSIPTLPIQKQFLASSHPRQIPSSQSRLIQPVNMKFSTIFSIFTLSAVAFGSAVPAEKRQAGNAMNIVQGLYADIKQYTGSISATLPSPSLSPGIHLTLNQ